MPRLLIALFLSLAFVAPAWATTRYVSTTGSDANSCAASENIATPKLTPASAIACMSAGDTLYFRGGTYTTQTSLVGVAGTSGNYKRLEGYPGETATFTPSTASGRPFVFNSTVQWIYFKHMVWNGANHVQGNPGLFVQNADNLVFDDIEITNWYYNGLYFEGNTNVQVINSYIHDQRTVSCASGSRWYGIYLHDGSNFTISNTRIIGNPAAGMHLYPGAISNVTITGNIIQDNSINCPGSPWGGIVVFEDLGRVISDITIARNIISGNGGPTGSADGIALSGSSGTGPSTVNIYHNILYDNHDDGIEIQTAGTTTTTIKNNLLFGNGNGAVSNGGTGTSMTYNACTGAATCGTDGKVTITALTDCTVSTSDFTQKAGSSCIDAGTAVTGFAYNGSAPDIGVFETVAFSSCVVEDGDASTIRVTFENNVYPPLLPASGITGFTARKAGANDVITAAVRTGDNRVDLTLTDAIANGNAVDISFSGSGNLTDSALVGNTTNQGYKTVLTNQSCTNNVGAAAGHVFTQAAFEFHGLRGTEAAPVGTPYATAPENTNIHVIKGGSVRLRVAITCTTADCPATGFYPFYSCAACTTAGTYTQVPDSFVADEDIGFCGTSPDPDIPTNGTATTNQLSTAGDFVPGAFVRTSNAIPTLTIPSGDKSELEYCFSFSPSATAARTYDIRLYKQDSTAIDTYTVTPRMTIAPVSSGMGF